MPKAINRPSLPRGIWVLGLVSMLMDISSEMVHSLLPVFLVSTLGASVMSVGIIEGTAQALALFTKLFSGTLSDVLGKRKPLALMGYGLAALTKPVFAMATSIGWIMSARFVDRIGKGIRGAPRDALVSDITPSELRGASYGLRQSLDTVGAVLGPILALTLMALLANDIRAVFWFAIIPAGLAVALLWLGIREEGTKNQTTASHTPIHIGSIRQFDFGFWWVAIIGAVLTLAQFSEAFLILRAEDIGLSIAMVPLVLIIMNIAYALSAYPAGVLSDRLSRRSVIATGVIVLILADIILATATGIVPVMIGVVLWGLYMGLTHGVLATLVTDNSPAHLRGTAFGLFNLLSGIALLLASLLAGWLWDQYGAPATFYTGAVFAVIALMGLMTIRTPKAALQEEETNT